VHRSSTCVDESQAGQVSSSHHLQVCADDFFFSITMPFSAGPRFPYLIRFLLLLVIVRGRGGLEEEAQLIEKWRRGVTKNTLSKLDQWGTRDRCRKVFSYHRIEPSVRRIPFLIMAPTFLFYHTAL
jgi:hypothetical protein